MFNPYSMSPYDVSLQTASVNHRHGHSLGIPEGHVPILLRGRAQTENLKQRPVLGLRTRSDFSRSITPLGNLPYSSSTSPFLSGSQYSPSTSTSEISQWQDDRPESFTRSLLTKSSMLLRRKNSNRANLTSLRILEWVEDTESKDNGKHIQEISKRRRSKHSRKRSVGYETMLKQSISDPYNFQHLTHTGAHDAKALKNASQNDLVTEFSAIRASQAPRSELRGIRAECLHSRRNSTELPPTPPIEGPTTPPSLSPSKTRDQWSSYAQRKSRGLQYSQSIDTLAHISPRSFSSPTPPISPPPRRSSKGQSKLPYDSLTTVDSPTRPPFPNSPLFSNPSRPMDSPTLSDPSAVGHAITTPDDTAFTLNPRQRSSSTAGLADVPEEDEGYPWMRHPVHKASLSTASSAIRHTKSFPSTSPSPSQSGRASAYSHSSSSTERNAASDPTLPSGAHEAEDIPSRRRSQQASLGMSFKENSWEKDIEYCYEHAAEADCAFDWDRVSLDDNRMSSATEVIDDIINSAASSFENIPDEDGKRSVVDNDSTVSFPDSSRSSSYDYVFSNSSPLGTRYSDTTLPHSSVSSTITVPGIVTPGEPAFVPQIINQSARTSQGSVMFTLSPSLLIPKEYGSRPTDDDVFQDKINDGEYTKHQYPDCNHRIDTGVHRNGSFRSNDSLLSTCHSQDSILPSPATSIDPRCRNSNSMGSLPELIFSKNSRGRPENISVRPTGQLAAGKSFRADSDTLLPSVLRKATSTTSIAAQSQQSSASAPVARTTSPRRERSQSDSADRMLKSATANPVREGSTGRMRSKTSVSSLSGTKSSRTSTYSLFPTVTAR